jgi:hypothetical protein
LDAQRAGFDDEHRVRRVAFGEQHLAAIQGDARLAGDERENFSVLRRSRRTFRHVGGWFAPLI